MADPWIRVHAMLRQKSVTFRAMDALGLKRAAAIGHLVMFWSAVSQCGTNGQVADCSDAQLEEWGGWEGTRGRFAKFIRESHLDESGRVREWDDYAGTLETRREKDRQRQRDKRERERADVRVTSDGRPRDVTQTSAPTIRNDTKRDERTEEKTSRRAKKPPTEPAENWVATLHGWWTTEVGAIAIGLLGKLAKPIHESAGDDAIKEAAKVYFSPDEGPRYKTPADFFGTFAYWHNLSKEPMYRNGDLTPRGQRLSRAS